MASTASKARSDETKRRILDVTIATVGLVVLSPLFAIVALLNAIESPGPLFFTQKRVGKDEKPFEIIKFRSMHVQKPQEKRVETNIGDMDSFTFRPTGSKTVVGRALRMCSLDELPNLFNVLKGDLHLVGPRPDEVELVEQYKPEWRRRHDVKPGITGLAQTNGRADLPYGEMMAYDLDYVDDHPFERDVRIIMQTLGVVARREGAR